MYYVIVSNFLKIIKNKNDHRAQPYNSHLHS